jgi:hypothetical protein
MSNWMEGLVVVHASMAVDAIEDAQLAYTASGESAAVTAAFTNNANATAKTICGGFADLDTASVAVSQLDSEYLLPDGYTVCDALWSISQNHAPGQSNLSGAKKHAAAVSVMVKRRRGRPTKMSDDLKDRAQAIKDAGGTDRETAMLLYSTPDPTVRQVKDAASLLSRHRKKRAGAVQVFERPTE